MSLAFVKETFELDSITTDSDGNAFAIKRINLRENMRHQLLQVDLFEDAIPRVRGGAEERPNVELAISPYPLVPTLMPYSQGAPVQSNRYPSAGDGSVLFKANGDLFPEQHTDFKQFPSKQIASGLYDAFYANHVYLNFHLMGLPDTEYGNIALSFYMVLDDTKVPVLESAIGILAESHNAMCSELMSQGHMVSRETLYGSVFPMWRYGGIRPEHTLSASATGQFWLPIATTDSEQMSTTAQIRSAVKQARAMQPFDASFGDKFPDWLKFMLPAGIISGEIRDAWPPTKYHDNGNLMML